MPAFLRRYGCSKAAGDRYSAGWVSGAFQQHGITYEPSAQTKSELFIELVALINSRQAVLLDHPRLLGQLAGLQRRAGRSGRDSVDHRPGARDDAANSAAGALVNAMVSTSLAQLPAEFRSCYRAASISSFRIETCYLFGGTFPGMNDVCCGGCLGHQFVRAARTAHEERTGERVGLIDFYRSRWDWKSHPLVERVRDYAWRRQDMGHW